MSNVKQIVYVGMSGGVDSSVAAALLKDQGYKVVGVYMKNWTQNLPGFECPWKEDFNDAKRVAVHLGIDLEVFDFQKEYKQKVIDYMIEEYKSGRTPNPDIMCNQEIKFKLFLETALERGADLIATGHYARIVRGRTSHTGLGVAKNKDKDQTYFLYRVTEEALDKTLFPIGEFKSKQEVRDLAKKYGLPTAEKEDSQGICFVGEVGINEFLRQYVEIRPGPIVDQHGQEIGEHEGAIFYTIGQRHGLNVGGGMPYYVTHKDMEANTVFVTTDLQDKLLWSKKVVLRDLHWINQESNENQDYGVRLRYRAPLVKAKIELHKDKAELSLEHEQRAVAVGQSAVLYDGDRCLGGGIISEVLH